ncbi:salicylate esterase [Mycobacterium florentinum]|uniref:Salicylate esterase n=1 Tax=Mycobacterium florentinum TaxID=292462 RepID=A0A1X1TU95_MYCFL|nr:alpha/beta fold hydrolase [Mycobacterium florentinum]MCV7408448.1 alpha/beta hydrolase [Mycobacterium florentinum]ORV47989.1 salicylate esterase [Mycobacterium florentinum]BBX78057.1 salicylate esterase [Mycobacterium florentinum]
MSTFVLVHGAWHDGSSWDRVIERLNAKGHKAFAPAIAGHGPNADRSVTHAEATRSIVDFVLDNGLSDIVLVGHSFGGTIICKAVEAIPEHVSRLVFVSGFVLNDGECLLDNIPPEDRAMLTQLASESADDTVTMPFEYWRQRFVNGTELATACWTYDRLSPQPFRPFCEPLDLEKFYALDTPKSYVVCTEDITLPPGEWGWHPRMSGRLGMYRLVQMPGNHEVIFTDPIGLADKIIEAGRD